MCSSAKIEEAVTSTMPLIFQIIFFLVTIWHVITIHLDFPGGSVVKNLPAMQETWVQSLDQADLLEKGMTTHSRILAWRIPRTEEPGRLHSHRCKESDTTEAT